MNLWALEISVQDRASLLKALKQAKGGEVLLLAAGDYGELDLWADGPVPPVYAEPVILRAAAASPPIFTRLKLTGARNLAFEGVLFDYIFAAGDAPGQTRPFHIKDSTNIRFTDVIFDGDVASGRGPEDNGYAAGIGLSARHVTRFTLQRSEIRSFYRGLVVGEGTDVLIAENDLHDLRSDGMNFVKATGLRVEGNVIRDFRRSFASRDHADMIQFWSMNADYPTTDVVIRRNFLTVGNGDHTQSIFMRNEAVDTQGGDLSMYYRDIVIEENLILNNHFHGITVGETDGLTIRRNTLIRVPRRSEPGIRGTFANMPGIQVADSSRNVTVRANVASRVPKVQAGWKQVGNAIVQDLEAFEGGYYPRVFANPFAGKPYRPENFKPVSGALLDRSELGAPLSIFRWGE